MLLPSMRGDRHAAGAARGEGTTVQCMIFSPSRGEEPRSGGGERVGLIRSVHAANSTITTKKIKNVPVGQVIKVGDSKFVKVAANGWMATETASFCKEVSYAYISDTLSYRSNCGIYGYYLASDNSYKIGCPGTLSGGFCWDTLDNTTYTWTDSQNGCDTGYTVPSKSQFDIFLSNMGNGNQIYNSWRSTGMYWSSTPKTSKAAYALNVNGTYTNFFGLNYGNQEKVRCIKN